MRKAICQVRWHMPDQHFSRIFVIVEIETELVVSAKSHPALQVAIQGDFPVVVFAPVFMLVALYLVRRTYIGFFQTKLRQHLQAA